MSRYVFVDWRQAIQALSSRKTFDTLVPIIPHDAHYTYFTLERVFLGMFIPFLSSCLLLNVTSENT
ncbi:hypothetical protein BDR06DRAFT_306368 [Suillus hirtellus]|nr:hypothetical protein BDR06DRAFT_306368 [Suillus hirtellus]